MYVYSLIKCQRLVAAENVVNNTLDTETVCLGDLVCWYFLLGLGNHKKGQYRKSMRKLTSADGYTKSLLLNVPQDSVAATYGLMGLNYEALGDSYSALLFHEKSLNVRINLYRHTDHPDIADSYKNMANVYDSQCDYSKALRCWEKNLNMNLNIYGHADHPDVASSYNNIALFNLSQGDYSKAMHYNEKSLKMRLAVHQTAPHSDVVDSYRNIADVSVSLSDFPSAVQYYQESLAVLQQLYCDAEEVKFLYIHDRLIVAQYYSWFSDDIEY